jgi:hypothetical protein
MKYFKNLLPILVLSAPFVSNNAMATGICADVYRGDKFQVAQIDDDNNAMCIYSAEAMYPVSGKVRPIAGFGSRWKLGHGGWYCRPTNQNPEACKFKAITKP